MDSKVKKIGKYEIVSILGEGAMGVVYKGLDPIIERHVAIKTIRHNVPELEGEDIKARFIREAQAAGRIHHPNIVGVYEYNQDADRDYIVMEFVQGVSLAEHISKHGRLGVKEACDIMVKVLEALDFAHSKGVVHRDIKPGNIILSDSGEVKVTDFGIARIESSTLTKVGTVVGTPSYMSPEQLLGQSVDQRSDIFSAGTLLYRLLTGEKPFSGPNVTAVIYRIVHNEHTHPSSLEPELTEEFDDILARALAKRPEERFQTAKEFAAALAGVAEKISIPEEHPAAEDGKTKFRAESSQFAAELGWLDNAPREPTVPSKPALEIAEAQSGDGAKAPRTPGKNRSFLILGVVMVSVLATAVFWLLTKEQEPGLKLAEHKFSPPAQTTVSPEETQPETPEPALSPPVAAKQPGGQASTFPSQAPLTPQLADVEPLVATFVALAEGDLRQAPSTEAARLDAFGKGARLEVTGKVRGKDWYRVKAHSGATGYARGALLRRTRTRDSVSPGETFRDCPTCPDLVVVPSGSFYQGSPPTETEREDSEGPQHLVHIAYPVAVGRHEVTKAEFAQFVTQTDHQVNGCWVYDGQWTEVGSMNWQNPGFAQDDSHPVTCVSWNDAQAYVRWLSAKTGESYRLLSDSEWEYAARARIESSRFWNNDLNAACDSANVADLASEQRYKGWQVHNCWDDYVHTAPVGLFKPNDFGLYDMLGNVFEWVQDCWNSDYRSAPTDGSPRLEGDCEHRVLRGGSWFSMPRYVRLAFRNRYNADYRSSSFGFRVARVLR